MRLLLLWLCLALLPAQAANPPNILWIFGDDIGLELGCYGDRVVRTPNLDRLAAQGTRYTRAFTTAPVCSPSRSAMMTGIYQTSLGAHHHRSQVPLPAGVKTLTDLLRSAHYYTGNLTAITANLRGTGKTDFNFPAPRAFDTHQFADLPAHQPFFAEINFSEPHRGPAWTEARSQPGRIDPAAVVLPPYYPDHPVVRADFANYLEAIQLLDRKVGRVLALLDESGLGTNTVVMFIGDNGRCHYRDKQFLYDGGIHVPLIIRWPGRLQPGSVDTNLVSAIDLTATTLDIAGVALPVSLQGRPLFGPRAGRRDVIFAARDRCDETVDQIRCLRTATHKYIRNFRPELPYAQPNHYKDQSYPALRIVRELHAAGKLTPAEALFMAPAKPPEELYDLERDPHEIHNLAASAEHQELLVKHRRQLEEWMRETGDRGPADPNPRR